MTTTDMNPQGNACNSLHEQSELDIILDDILLNNPPKTPEPLLASDEKPKEYKYLNKPVVNSSVIAKGGYFNNDQEIVIYDVYNEKTQKNILHGRHEMNPNKYDKFITNAIIKSYIEENKANNMDNNNITKKFTTLYDSNKDFTYDDLINVFGKVSLGCLISNALKAFQHHDLELLIKCHNVFSNPIPLKDGKDTWLDNWSLNGPGYALTFIFDKQYNSPDVVALSGNEEHDIIDVSKFRKHDYVKQSEIKNKYNTIGVLKFVNIFRAFLICNHLLPTIGNDYVINTAADIWETCAKYFPVYYIGANACDWYNDEIAPSMETIDEFIKAFPNKHVISIINVSASYQGGGTHWMGLDFINVNNIEYAKLMCSQSSSWSVFTDGGTLNNKINTLGFCKENNMVCLQKDPSNCGVYSLLFLYMVILYNGDIKKAAKTIGVNAKDIKDGFDIYNIKHTLFGF